MRSRKAPALLHLVFRPDPSLPARGRLLWYHPHDGAPRGDVGVPGIVAQRDEAALAVPAGDTVRRTTMPVAAAPLSEALGPLLAHRVDDRIAGHRTSVTTAAYVRAARLAAGLTVEQQIAPVLREAGGDVVAAWRALLSPGGRAADALAALAEALPAAGHALVRDDGSVWHPRALLREFVDACVDALARDPTAEQRPGRPRARLLPWTARWQEAAADPLDATVPLGAERGEAVAGVREWLRPFERPTDAFTPELTVEAPARPGLPWHMHFGLRDADGGSVPAAALWRDGADTEAVEALLEALARAARVFVPIERALDQRDPTHATFDTDVAWRFVDRIAPLLADAGFAVALPDELAELRPRIQLGSVDDGQPGDRVALTWQATVGDAVIDAPTVDQLMEDPEPLVFWQGRWVRITPDVRAEWQQRRQGLDAVPLLEALGLAVAGVATGLGRVRGSDATQVTTVGPLATLVDRLRHASERSTGAPPGGFHGQLRPYQADAVGWLDMMADLGLGGVLADDMGLGKTVMLIAHLLSQGRGPHLVVCPTSVVANWERELARFAPGLPRHRHHGPDRPASVDDVTGVVVTSYGTLRRDIDVLAGVAWHVVALDEAQQVKNPDTLGARAVRRLSSAHCVALTGTPVENRLRELWSMLDFTNPGLLGPRARFERRYANPIERRSDQVARAQLRRLIGPFVLRRTKADPRVAVDLPPRIERTVPCVLTDEQRARYRAAVDRFRRGLHDGQSAMQRRGAVLALLTRLKQICDHPALAGDGLPTVGRSGKLAVAAQLVEEATQAGERVLVFTQFVGMAELLRDEFSRQLAADVPVLHGGLSGGARQRLVDRFQGESDTEQPPVLVASLRAGGTGLNLTAASQVIHYDRWWNPAVEDQASDRAHRIGQTSRVLIHRLVTMGTLEERIDAMLSDKREIAASVVGTGETWLTELGTDELLEIVDLSTGDDLQPVGRP